MAGRPRTIDDATILRAAVEVIGRSGPDGLTLAAVAKQAGVVPGTLMQRFGSKRGLLLAIADHSLDGMTERPARIRARHPSAVAALTALLVEWAEPLATPESYANHLAFLCVDLTDPDFHQRALAIQRARRGAVTGLLAEAAEAGELRRDGFPGVGALTEAALAVTSGAGLLWAVDREGTLAQRLSAALATVLAPHLTGPPPTGSPPPTGPATRPTGPTAPTAPAPTTGEPR
ncbi:TetR/AcrR family transcriptional regulator [Streptomyces sp. CA-111067]|uniref:TetR/AcrR family transcriptional regulator n=1 Tax=Streptomyces sp. CA-111067 TaxID=3240046 RepID=UPI003D951CE8